MCLKKSKGDHSIFSFDFYLGTDFCSSRLPIPPNPLHIVLSSSGTLALVSYRQAPPFLFNITVVESGTDISLSHQICSPSGSLPGSSHIGFISISHQDDAIIAASSQESTGKFPSLSTTRLPLTCLLTFPAYLWRTADLQLIKVHRIPEEIDLVTNVAWAVAEENHQIISASGSRDGSVHVWTIE